MKLFTEEQVIDFAMCMISQYEFGNKNIWNKELLKESLDCKPPIELPSDEEIEKETKDFKFKKNKEIFYNGAKWMKEQILKQNK